MASNPGEPSDADMTPARYTTLFLLLSTLLLSLLASVNYLVDPFFLFRSKTIPGINELRNQFFNYQLLSKPYALIDYQADTLILGSSRTGTALRPAHPGFEGSRVYNGALAGSTLRANILHYRHAMAAAPLKRVLINPDFYMFNAYQRPANPAAYRDFEKRLLVHQDGSSNLRRPARVVSDYLDSMLGWNSLKSSYRTRARLALIERGDAPYLTIHPDGHWTNQVALNRRHADYFKQVERIYIPDGWVPPDSHRFDFNRTPGSDPIDLFREFLEHAYENEVEVIITFMPYHARLLEAMHLIGIWDQSEEWKRLKVETVEQVARKRGMAPFPVWDFTGYNSVNMDPLPDRDLRGNHMRWYRDSSHVQQHTGDMILDRVLGYETAGRTVPADFGTRIHSGNIESHLAAINARRQEFRNRFPADVADIQRMVERAGAMNVVDQNRAF